jgi:hypothetical protein
MIIKINNADSVGSGVCCASVLVPEGQRNQYAAPAALSVRSKNPTAVVRSTAIHFVCDSSGTTTKLVRLSILSPTLRALVIFSILLPNFTRSFPPTPPVPPVHAGRTYQSPQSQGCQVLR